jgi:hypothetical protein
MRCDWGDAVSMVSREHGKKRCNVAVQDSKIARIRAGIGQDGFSGSCSDGTLSVTSVKPVGLVSAVMR